MVPLEKALGMTRAQSSLGFSLMLLAEGLLAFPVGRWIDRGHERAVMTGGSLLVGLAFLAHSQISSVPQFYAVWTLLGVGLAGTLYPPAFAVLTRRFPQHFRRAIAELHHRVNQLLLCKVIVQEVLQVAESKLEFRDPQSAH